MDIATALCDLGASAGCGPNGSAMTSRGSWALRWLPGTTRVGPLACVKSSISQIELHTR